MIIETFSNSMGIFTGNINKLAERKERTISDFTAQFNNAVLPKKKYKAKVAARNGASVVVEIARALQAELPEAEIRTSCIGHAQRGGAPDAYDREISTRFGIEGARLIMNKNFGQLVILKHGEVSSIPLADTAGQLKYVDPQCKTISNVRLMGISFGDETALAQEMAPKKKKKKNKKEAKEPKEAKKEEK
ncbi:MAG: 6-phosphofructokinase [bacterium]